MQLWMICCPSFLQSLTWSFGFNSSLPVHNVSEGNRKVRLIQHLMLDSFVRSSTTSVHLFSLQMIFYVSSHTGILYDCTANKQCLLQGHVSREVEGEVEGGFNLYVSSPMYTTPSQSNPITCSAVSGDKRWLVTADIGTDCMLIVWDSYSA